MKFAVLILLIIALAIPASASSVVSWTKENIPGYNLTLNYTSEFNVTNDDVLGITIINIGNESENDTIKVNKIRVIGDYAEGLWTGPSVTIDPNSSNTIPFDLNVTTDDIVTFSIRIYFSVNLETENETRDIQANYYGTPEAPELEPWNNITNNRNRTLSVNIDQAVRFNATADQPIDTWVWRKDNVVQDNDHDYFITSWATSGEKTVKVKASNENGTSDTITWEVTVNPNAGGNAPYITSWGNNKTNDSTQNITINQSETVQFNFTANQTLTSWRWTLNGETISNPSDTLIRKFNSNGNYQLRASGANGNGSTQTIRWNVTVKGTYERDEDDHNKINPFITFWNPEEVVDYIYVNDTVSKTIDYSITTAEPLMNVRWTEDGTVVSGYTTGNTYTYSRTWENITEDLGFHTIRFKGTIDADNEVEFKWYVYVYEIDGVRGGSWFDVDYSYVKIKMFKYKIAKYGSNSEHALNFVNRLHDGIALRQMTREALRDAFKYGDLEVYEYVAALKQLQSNIKDDIKIAKRVKDLKKGIEKDDEEGDQDDSYQSERVKQNKVNKQESKEDKKKDRSVTSNSNGKKKGNKNNGRDDENKNEDDNEEEDD